MFQALTLSERAALIRKMRNAVHTNRVEAQARAEQPTAATGTSFEQHILSMTECAQVVLAMYPDPEPVA